MGGAASSRCVSKNRQRANGPELYKHRGVPWEARSRPCPIGLGHRKWLPLHPRAGARGRSRRGVAGPGPRKERGRVGPDPGLGPTGVSGGSPRHKRPGWATHLCGLGPSVVGWGHPSQGSRLPVCAPIGGSAAACPIPAPVSPYLAFPVAGVAPRPVGRQVPGGHPRAGSGGCAVPRDAGPRPHGGWRRRRSAPPAGQSAEPRFLPLCGRTRPAEPGTPAGTGRGEWRTKRGPGTSAPPAGSRPRLRQPGLRADPQPSPRHQVPHLDSPLPGELLKACSTREGTATQSPSVLRPRSPSNQGHPSQV